MLEWDKTGEKEFETGVDRGVLYPPNAPGVAWNGLTSVDEKPEGDAPTFYYFEGNKSLAVPSNTDFAGTLSAFMYPREFEPFDGMDYMTDGVIVTQQPNQLFGLSYRTLVGNDIEGDDLGYKLHLLYNCLASPSDKNYGTTTNSVDLSPFSWEITTTPVITPGFRPMAHLILDSRRLTPTALHSLESVLYGEFDDPRLPLPYEVLSLTLGNRFIIDIDTPATPLPPSAEEGDAVYSKSDYSVYSNGPTLSDQVRPVFVITEGEPTPESVIPGDVVFNQTTGDLYRVTP